MCLRPATLGHSATYCWYKAHVYTLPKQLLPLSRVWQKLQLTQFTLERAGSGENTKRFEMVSTWKVLSSCALQFRPTPAEIERSTRSCKEKTTMNRKKLVKKRENCVLLDDLGLHKNGLLYLDSSGGGQIDHLHHRQNFGHGTHQERLQSHRRLSRRAYDSVVQWR